MKGMKFKKAFLLSGILLLSVFVVIQLSWACDDDDNWDHDCHDKWHWDHDCWTCNPPKIQIVYLKYFTNSIEFRILGKNFAKGGPPVVTLGGIYNLTVDDNNDDEEIIATLPIEGNSFPYGDYRLVVSTCHDSSCEYKYCKDYCFQCKGKHCKDYCSKCKDRYCKHKYCKDHDYKCRCKDRYSLTIADPSGTGTCPPGTFVTVIVTAMREEFTEVASGIFSGRASCETAGPGYSVTGGGFSLGNSTEVIVMESKPYTVQTGTGWELVVTGGPANGGGPPPGVTAWAVCGKVQ